MTDTPIAKLLKASIEINELRNELAEKNELIARQRRAYALAHNALIATNIKLLRIRMDIAEGPALLRRQAD